MLASLRSGNLLLAFLLEVGMLAALCFAGWTATNVFWMRLALAIAMPGVAIVLWAAWAAPRAKTRLRMPALMGFKIAIFAVATAALWAAGQPFIAAIFGTLVAINLLAMWAFGQV